MEKYVDTTLIDCNRLFSTEYKGGNTENPALFTNEISDGIKLEVGDEVNVHGAYISEIGAGSDTIEIKGKLLKDK